MERIIVRRGRFHVYELLRRMFGRDKNIEIVWDRRAPLGRDNGAPHGDRRERPLVEWNQLDYIFASGARPDLLTHDPHRRRRRS